MRLKRHRTIGIAAAFTGAATAMALLAAGPRGTIGTADARPVTTTADLVLHNGKIVTVDPAHGTVQALAIRDDRIVAVGTRQEMDAHVGPQTELLDLQGALAVPGFIEGHGHFVGLGESKMNLDLTGVSNWDEVITIVAEAVARTEPGDWIVGRGWHQEKWDKTPTDDVEGFPTHHGVSAVSPENPVVLTHASGHANFANKKAMDLSGISASTPDPAGGDILRDDAGNPIGVFRETAQGLVRRSGQSARTSRRERLAQTDRAIDLAVQECLSKGVTSFQDAGSPFYVIDSLTRRAESGTLGVRLWVMIRESNDRLAQYVDEYKDRRRVGNDSLTVGGVKRTIDGALGPRGAWLLEPYSDSPESTGLATATVEDVTESGRIALQSDLQFCVHAIGDRANREVLDLFERLWQGRAGGQSDGRELRWRIEHAQHLHPDDIGRFGALGVIASMQGVHCTSDGPWVYRRLGAERAREGAYVWQKLLQSGAVVTNGTDAPVEDVDPIASYYATVSRKLNDGSVFFADQRMSRMEALRSYTIDAAFAAFEEDIKGSLTPGKLADIVILSKDILTVPEEQIPETRVARTIVGGKTVYER
jgi:predicted amidohydrolase YtcJ